MAVHVRQRDLLKGAGIDPQSLTTWEGLKTAGEKLTKDGKFGIGFFGHMGEDTVVAMNSFIYSNGGSVLNEDGTCALTEPEAVGGPGVPGLSSPTYAPEGILNSASGDMRELFLNGSWPRSCGPRWSSPRCKRAT